MIIKGYWYIEIIVKNYNIKKYNIHIFLFKRNFFEMKVLIKRIVKVKIIL